MNCVRPPGSRQLTILLSSSFDPIERAPFHQFFDAAFGSGGASALALLGLAFVWVRRRR